METGRYKVELANLVPALANTAQYAAGIGLNRLIRRGPGNSDYTVPAGGPTTADFFDRVVLTRPDRYEFPNDPVVSISGGIRTAVDDIPYGSQVVQLTGINLHRVTLTGAFWDGTGEYPSEQRKAFHRAIRRQQKYDVASKMLADHEIRTICILDYNIDSQPGTPEMQAYKIEAIEVRELELEIIDRALFEQRLNATS